MNTPRIQASSQQEVEEDDEGMNRVPEQVVGLGHPRTATNSSSTSQHPTSSQESVSVSGEDVRMLLKATTAFSERQEKLIGLLEQVVRFQFINEQRVADSAAIDAAKEQPAAESTTSQPIGEQVIRSAVPGLLEDQSITQSTAPNEPEEQPIADSDTWSDYDEQEDIMGNGNTIRLLRLVRDGDEMMDIAWGWFLVAFQIEGLGYYNMPEWHRRDGSTLTHYHLLLHSKPMCHLKGLEHLAKWGEFEGPPDGAKSQLQSEDARRAWRALVKSPSHITTEKTIKIYSDTNEFEICFFQLMLFCCLWRWHGTWTVFLADFDGMARVELSTILDSTERRGLMLDNDHLDMSDHYFQILQLLRVITRWIRECQENIRLLQKAWEHDLSYRPVYVPHHEDRIVSDNWEALKLYHGRLVEELLNNIDRKSEDIKSLRDGLFNATSVKEATKSGEINRYIFVFTIATIIYLPFSFVTSAISMHIFDDPAMAESRKQFWAAILPISIGTYAVLASYLWLRRDKKEPPGPKDKLAEETESKSNERSASPSDDSGEVSPSVDSGEVETHERDLISTKSAGQSRSPEDESPSTIQATEQTDTRAKSHWLTWPWPRQRHGARSRPSVHEMETV